MRSIQAADHALRFLPRRPAKQTGESTELDPVAYADVLAEVAEAVRAHEAELVVAPNVAGGDPQYCLCCDPRSQDRYPEYPPCTCNPENW